jgi:Flp pilus assembly protein TadD
MTPEMIAAIAGLWKLVAALAVLILPIAFRRSLVESFGRLKTLQLKRDKVELAAELTGTKLVKEAEAKELSTSEVQVDTKSIVGAPVAEPATQLAEVEAKDTSDPFITMIDAAFEERSLADTEEAYKKLQESTTDEEAKLENEAFYYYLRYDLGDTSAISKLQDMSKAEKVAPYANQSLAYCYDTSGDYGKAAIFFELAAQGYEKKGAANEPGKIRNVLHAADRLFKQDLKQEAYARIMNEIVKTSNDLSLSDLYAGLASLYEQDGESDLRAIALEKAIAHKPNDIGLRFSAGLTYGKENATHAISLLHYKTLLQFNKKHASALNNIGVQYERLQMSIRSVRSYKESASLNQTLAAANLASLYTYAGFAEEAHQLLDNAKQQPKIDPRVGEEIARLAKKEDEEAKAEEAQLKIAREQQRFLLPFAEAYFVPALPHPDFEGLWTSSNGTLVTIHLNGGTIQANWAITENLNERFTGGVSNRAAKIKYERLWVPEIKDDRYGYAYLSPDGKELHILIMGLATHTIEILKKNSDQSLSPSQE